MSKKVFVSGCYDMLHSGHVAFFEDAAQYGDLYVGIGSDKTINELKARKTVNSDAERLYMVKSLKVVKDAWINQGGGLLDFLDELETLKPDIFFVNADVVAERGTFTFVAKQGLHALDVHLMLKQERTTGLPEHMVADLLFDA